MPLRLTPFTTLALLRLATRRQAGLTIRPVQTSLASFNLPLTSSLNPTSQRGALRFRVRTIMSSNLDTTLNRLPQPTLDPSQTQNLKVAQPENVTTTQGASAHGRTGKESTHNAAGLNPEETKSLPERPVKGNEWPIISAIRELYSCKPTSTSFNIYTGDATFHDPIGLAAGLHGIRSQFIGLAKLFPRADILKFRILQTPPTLPPNTILIDQDIAYYRSTTQDTTPTKVVNSLLTLRLNEQGTKVVKHTEEWDHKKTSSKEDGFFGMLNEMRKKATAGITNIIMGKDVKRMEAEAQATSGKTQN